MEKLIALGTGSALPIKNRGASAQIIQSGNSYFLIDCGEGTQLKLRDLKIPFLRINHIFISHLHGDHFLGLPGLISSFNLLNRQQKLKVFGPKGLREIIEIIFKYSYTQTCFELEFVEWDCKFNEPVVIEENKQLTISTFSLNHRIPCYGYWFQEKQKDRKLLSSAIQKYNIPIQFRGRIKQGMDYVMEDGYVIPNELLTEEPKLPISFAYCSDNRIKENQLDFLKNTTYLYHEATFTQELLDRAKTTMHSTALEAASLAKNLNVQTLLLGHFSARYTDVKVILNEAKTVFPNSVALYDGKEIVFESEI